MGIKTDGEPFIWLPKSQKQLQMTAEEIQVDNYCRDVLQIFNKATPQNIDSLLEKMTTIRVNSELNITKLARIVVHKAVDEPLYGEVYSEMCFSLNQFIDRITSGTEATKDLCGLFKALILTQCEARFNHIFDVERCDEDIVKGGNEYIKDYDYVRRQKIFGIVFFIAQLYKKELFSYNDFKSSVDRLLEKRNEVTLEFQIECFCKLMRMIGETLECLQDKKELLDEWFSKLNMVCLENVFCSRVRFAVLDLVEIRSNNWVGRPLLQLPKTIDEIRCNSNTGATVVTRRQRRKKT